MEKKAVFASVSTQFADASGHQRDTMKPFHASFGYDAFFIGWHKFCKVIDNDLVHDQKVFVLVLENIWY